MRLRPCFALVAGLCLLMGACATVPEAPTPPLVSLDRAVHFMTPEGGEVVTGQGTYRVEPAEGSQLRLSPEEASQNKPTLLIEALTTSFDLEVPAPVALSIVWQEDEHHLILLHPGKTAFEAVGSYSGVRPRSGTVYLTQESRYTTTIRNLLQTKQSSSQSMR